MAGFNATPLLITSKVSGLSAPTKGARRSEWLKEQDLPTCTHVKTEIYNKRTERAHRTNTNGKKAGVARHSRTAQTARPGELSGVKKALWDDKGGQVSEKTQQPLTLLRRRQSVNLGEAKTNKRAKGSR